MNDRDSLFAAILADPADDLPRLALADWLEEYGDEEAQVRARFIRLQLRLAGMKESTIERHGMILGEAAILGEQFVRWTAPLSGLLGMRVCEATPDLAMPPPGHVAVRFRRGFVADLVCYPAQWADRHCDILALCPLERVAFIDSVDREYHEMLPNSWRGGRASLVSTRWLPRGDLAVRLVSAPHEIMVPNAKLAMHGYGPCVNEAGLELCHRAWPGIQFLVARKEP